MELTILGSGTYEPEVDRKASGYLVQTGGQNLVFDFGRGSLDQLIRSGIEYTDIDYIFITHTHTDHCSDLAPLLHISLIDSEHHTRNRNKKLFIYGPMGLKETVDHIKRAFHLEKKEPKHKIHVIELKDGDVVKGKDFSVQAFSVEHILDNCLAYRTESQGKVLAYSGDTRYCQGILKASKDSDLAIIEASWQKGLASQGHLTAEDTGRIAQEAGAKKLVLTHIAPSYLKNYDVEKESRVKYQGPILIAKDLMKITV
jgi:ribonuclease BN (tRNA processing enzyme)